MKSYQQLRKLQKFKRCWVFFWTRDREGGRL